MAILVLPERDYVTFACLLSQIRLSVVCHPLTSMQNPTEIVPSVGGVKRKRVAK